jgi:hypothetical protein
MKMTWDNLNISSLIIINIIANKILKSNIIHI